ncbi:MAG: hypothetical protein ACOX69_04065 [Coriobacteriales bacterium]
MVDHVAVLGAGCIEVTLVVDHVAVFDTRCIERALVVDHAAGLDALSAPSELG